MAEEKRVDERVPVLGELPGATTIVQPMAIKELSRKGVQVETAFALQIDSLHEFRLLLGDRPVVVKGRVAHCRICDVNQDQVIYRAGVEFVEPPEWAARAIQEFIEDMKAGRRG
jgi:hypothetical protein